MVEGKFVIATVAMIVIFFIICFLLFLIVTSFQRRREAVGVQLPIIDERGVEIERASSFSAIEDLTIELIDAEEDDAVSDNNIVTDDREFLTALTMETGQYVSDDTITTSSMKMPEVGEIDYEQIKEDRRLEKEQEAVDRLRELAEADSQEEIDKINSRREDSSSSIEDDSDIQENLPAGKLITED